MREVFPMKIPKFSFLTDPLISNAAGRDMNTNTGRNSLVKCHFERDANIVLQYNTLPIEDYNLNLKKYIYLLILNKVNFNYGKCNHYGKCKPHGK